MACFLYFVKQQIKGLQRISKFLSTEPLMNIKVIGVPMLLLSSFCFQFGAFDV